MDSVKRKSCFVIGPIGENGSDIRKKADLLLEYVIRPATKDCGYEVPLRADLIAAPGMVSAQIIQQVAHSDLVVADLTGNNPNVFYELAVRHVARKPVVNLVEINQKVAFDVNQFRYIQYDLSEPRKITDTIEELKAHIQNGERLSVIENPIALAVDSLALVASKNPIETALAKLQEEVTEIHRVTVPRTATVDNLRAGDRIASPMGVFQRGLQVMHPTYGVGEIVEVDGEPSNPHLTIQFNDGLKKIVPRFVPLELVGFSRG